MPIDHPGSGDEVNPSYFPERLRLSAAMQERIRKGEVQEKEVRSKTSELFGLIHNAEPEGNTDIKGFVQMGLALGKGRIPRLLYERKVTNFIETNAHLIDFAANDAKDETLLHNTFTFMPETKVVRALLEHGTPADTPDGMGNTPLMVAATRRGHGALETLQLLLDAGANLDHCNTIGYNALSLAICHGQTEWLHALLQAGADSSLKLKEHADMRSLAGCSNDLQAVLHKPSAKELLQHWGERLDAAIRDVATTSDQSLQQSKKLSASCYHALGHLRACEEIWQNWQESPDVLRLHRPDLIAFARIGKLNDCFDSRLWRGHESLATQRLSELPPYLTSAVINHHSWLADNISQSPSGSRWTNHTSPAPLTERSR